jgi:hypothetical protein
MTSEQVETYSDYEELVTAAKEAGLRVLAVPRTSKGPRMDKSIDDRGRAAPRARRDE